MLLARLNYRNYREISFNEAMQCKKTKLIDNEIGAGDKKHNLLSIQLFV